MAAYTNRGISKGESGDYKGAIVDYDKVISLDPDDALFIVIVEQLRVD